jgi:Carboxypeptidase regulatory-like domain
MLSRRVAFSGVAFVCAGLIALVPLVDCPTCFAADPPAAQPPAKTNRPARRARPPRLPSSLVGRITDEKGAPVADAQLQIFPKDGGRGYVAKSQADGSYAIDRVESAGVYRLQIFSERCVSLSDWRDENLNIPLDPPKTVTRDFVLKPACRLHLTVVDEDDRPIPKVTIYRPGRSDGQFRQTNKEGKVTVGGMPPSQLISRFGFHNNDFAFEFLDVKLDDPKTIVERKVTLTAGKSVRGTVVCSDGKPAFGCHIRALPSWWDFGSFPSPELIQADGSFELKHIGPGTYKIGVSVPHGGGSSSSRDYLSDVDLFSRKDTLAIKTDFPSLGTMGFIEGRIRFKDGRRPKQGFWINANAPAVGPLTGGHWAQHDDNTFKIGPLPDGRYTLTIDSREIESKQLGPFAVGTKNIDLEVTVRGPTLLKGLVAGVGDNQPLKNLRIRLLKTRYLRGPNYEPNREWQLVADAKGAFTVEIPGPGVYVVEASADGYAISKSEPANTDTDLGKELRIQLSTGVSLSGMVVDETGRPINGATLLARSQFGKVLPVSAAKLSSGAGVATADGRFRFDHLSPGKETIRALHPEFVFAEVRDLELKEGAVQTPLTITMKRGGTVRGRVFDQFGRPAAGVPLHFRSSDYHDFEGSNEFAAGVSDDAGDYEVAHLPETLIYISRGNQWSSLGVVRLAVLPAAGKTTRVDFGGIKKVTGRLVVSRTPLANTKVMLSDEYRQGEMMAYAMTDAEGNFAFRGIPPGERYLYYSVGVQPREHWVRVKPLRIETSNDPFGTIEVVTATLLVHGPEADPNPNATERVSVWLSGHPSSAAPRQNKNDPFVFRDLPLGKYEVSLNQPRKLGTRQTVEITGPGDKSMSIDFRKGTASLLGHVKDLPPEPNRYLYLLSKDNRQDAFMDIKPDGSFGIDELPAGEYRLTPQPNINAAPLATFSLAEGQKKSISLTSLSSPAQSRIGFLSVKPYALEGLPLPGCEVTLTGPNRQVKPQSIQSTQITFMTEPGPYRLTVRYPGFAPLTKQVEVRAVQGTVWGKEYEQNVMLVRSTEQTKAETR